VPIGQKKNFLSIKFPAHIQIGYGEMQHEFSLLNSFLSFRKIFIDTDMSGIWTKKA
jgi:hypothetical protein